MSVETAETTVQDSLERLRKSSNIARQLDLFQYEDKEPQVIREEFLPIVKRSVSFSIDVTDEILRHYAGPEDQAAEDVDNTELESHELPTSDERVIVDLLRFARAEMKQARLELEAINEPADHWELLARCNRCRGTLVRTARNIEKTICDHEGWETELSIETDLAGSLIVRKIYRDLHSALSKEPQAESSNISDHLTSAEQMLTTILCSSARRHLRIADYCLLVKLRQRIAGWLADLGVNWGVSR